MIVQQEDRAMSTASKNEPSLVQALHVNSNTTQPFSFNKKARVLKQLLNLQWLKSLSQGTKPQNWQVLSKNSKSPMSHIKRNMALSKKMYIREFHFYSNIDNWSFRNRMELKIG